MVFLNITLKEELASFRVTVGLGLNEIICCAVRGRFLQPFFKIRAKLTPPSVTFILSPPFFCLQSLVLRVSSALGGWTPVVPF